MQCCKNFNSRIKEIEHLRTVLLRSTCAGSVRQIGKWNYLSQWWAGIEKSVDIQDHSWYPFIIPDGSVHNRSKFQSNYVELPRMSNQSFARKSCGLHFSDFYCFGALIDLRERGELLKWKFRISFQQVVVK